ncbi:transcription repressor OFP8 [Malania oleifera]|uniref:transcription repressor OFP8 n=1 Tax=Malania oleifera TaxID=397392 RepID=UPI0025AEC140|nr:transcription repressor OFP8 [Malania oleifera]
MENRFKLRLSRMFRSSFGSCRTSRNVSDVIEKPVFVSETHQTFHLFDPLPRKLQPPFPSICAAKSPTIAKATPSISITCKESLPKRKESLPRRKVSGRNSLLFSADLRGRLCPPASPISSLNHFCKLRNFESREATRKPSKKKDIHLKKHKKTERLYPFSSSSGDIHGGCGWGWFSSDEDEREDETETLFSSRSLSNSDSSDRSRRTCSRRKGYGARRRRAARKDSQLGVLPLDGKVKDSFAVVKRSSDPYGDFRTSMVEMIVEKQIFGAKELEQLLQCFLSLNSSHHHRVIVEVFAEIWEALFSDFSC